MNLTDIEITLADVAHAPDIFEIEKQSFSVPWSIKSIEDFLKNPDAICIVAKLDKVVGYVGMYEVCGEGDITNVAVARDYRGHGIASLLITALIQEAERRSLSKLMLEVRGTNQPALNLYKKYGFTQVGIRKNYYTNPKEDAILMDKIV